MKRWMTPRMHLTGTGSVVIRLLSEFSCKTGCQEIMFSFSLVSDWFPHLLSVSLLLFVSVSVFLTLSLSSPVLLSALFLIYITSFSYISYMYMQ